MPITCSWPRLEQWDGVPDKQNFTYVRLEDMYEDIPEMVVYYLEHTQKKKIEIAAATQLYF